MTPPAQHPQHEGHPTWEPYWLTPPELYKELDSEFHFDFDPCPFPKPPGYDGTKIEWGKSNYVNPPFHKENGIGPTAFVRKAIEENKKGKTVVLTIPTPSYVNLLLSAGAECRSLGRVKWLHTVTREPMPGPSSITAFILRSRPAPSAPRIGKLSDAELDEIAEESYRQITGNQPPASPDAVQKLLTELQEVIAQSTPDKGSLHDGWLLAYPIDRWISYQKKQLRQSQQEREQG